MRATAAELSLTTIDIANDEDCQKALRIAVDVDVRSGELHHTKYDVLAATPPKQFPTLDRQVITLRESHRADGNGWSTGRSGADGGDASRLSAARMPL